MNAIKYTLASCGCAAFLSVIMLGLFGVLSAGNKNNSAEPPPQVQNGALDGAQQNANQSGGGISTNPVNDDQTLKKRCGDIPEKLIDAINSGASSAGLSPAFIAAIAKQESGWRDDVIYGPVTSSVGAQGMMQIMPGTWSGLGGSGSPFDPQKSAYYGAKYLKQIYANFVQGPFNTNLYSEKAVKYTAAGYNAGPGHLSTYHGAPPFAETQGYIRNIWAYYQNYAGCLEGSGSGEATGNRASLAQQILAHSKITLLQFHVGNRYHPASTARQNIIDTSQGKKAALSPDCSTGSETDLSEQMLRAVLSLAQQSTLTINILAGGCHTNGSRHYGGRAVDFGAVNGQLIRAGHPNISQFLARCRELGAVEAFGPGDAGHDTHIHCAW
jgi:hypothetical protein